jgi:hypothetical protein
MPSDLISHWKGKALKAKFEQGQSPGAKRILGEEAYMRIGVYVLALAPFFFVGCAEEPTAVTTTTTTREVTTTGPATQPVAGSPAYGPDYPGNGPYGPGYAGSPGYVAAPGAVTVEIGDRPYYTHGPGYYVGRTYYVWRPGHWASRNGQRVWIRGHYVVRG